MTPQGNVRSAWRLQKDAFSFVVEEHDDISSWGVCVHVHIYGHSVWRTELVPVFSSIASYLIH